SSNRVLVPADQVQQRKQENPDNIDKVPVQAAEFNRREVPWPEIAARGAQQQPCKQSQANHHVKGVEAGHGEVEGEKDFRLRGDLSGRRFRQLIALLDFLRDVSGLATRTASRIKALADDVPGNMAFFVLVVIFFGFYAQEGRAQDHGADQEPDLSL